MARYELTDEHLRNLRAIIMDANIKGKDSPAIMSLMQALGNPIREMNVGKPNVKKTEDYPDGKIS